MRISDWSSDVCSSDLLDFEAASGRTSNGAADRVVEYITSNNLKVVWHIETHAHADHISAAPYLQEKLGGKLAIGRDIIRVQEVFGKLFNAGKIGRASCRERVCQDV